MYVLCVLMTGLVPDIWHFINFSNNLNVPCTPPRVSVCVCVHAGVRAVCACMYECLMYVPVLCYSSRTLCISGPKLSQGFIYDPRSGHLSLIFFRNHPTMNLSTNNKITLLVITNYIQLSATLYQQIHTIYDSIVRLFFD